LLNTARAHYNRVPLAFRISRRYGATDGNQWIFESKIVLPPQ